MIRERFRLKLASGKVVEWEGEDGEDAARRYVDVFQDATVVAHKPIRHGLFQYGRGQTMKEN